MTKVYKTTVGPQTHMVLEKTWNNEKNDIAREWLSFDIPTWQYIMSVYNVYGTESKNKLRNTII